MKLPIFPALIAAAALIFSHTALSDDAAQNQPVVAAPLEPLLGVNDLWKQIKGSTFIMETSSSFGFRWQSDLRETAESTRKGLTLFNLPVTQALAHFTGDALDRLTIIFYDRGDDGQIEQPAFNALTAKAAQAINAYTKTVGKLRPAQQTDVVQTNGMIWNTPQSQFILECSDNGNKPQVLSHQIPYRAEFVRLTITPPPAATNFYTQAFVKQSGPFNGKAHVHQNPINGDVMISDVPMIDQGQKGYCVVASASRLLRYYGKSVDENELAQIADTDSKKGTSLESMQKALQGLTAKLGVQSRPVLPYNGEDFTKFMLAYNIVARAQNKPIVDVNKRDSISNIMGEMDKDLIMKVRATPAAENHFLQLVQQYIDQGKPLLWSVTVGIFPETLPRWRDIGGHMRLIIGYNPKTREILYSDSFGSGFEIERMPLSEATAMTDALYLLEPIGA